MYMYVDTMLLWKQHGYVKVQHGINHTQEVYISDDQRSLSIQDWKWERQQEGIVCHAQ